MLRGTVPKLLRSDFGVVIGSVERASSHGKRMDVTDKFTGEKFSSVAIASNVDMNDAIASAHKSLAACHALPSYVRQDILAQISSTLLSQKEEISHILALEAGKPIKDSRVEVIRAAETFKLASEQVVETRGGKFGPMDTSQRNDGLLYMTRRYPIGVVGMITPFNFPLMLAAHKVAPAIAAGCPFVLKPSDYTPITAIMLGDIIKQTAWPKGALNVVPCEVDVAATISQDERVKMISFTGSPKVGWAIKNNAGKKKVVLELGGAAPCLIDADADVSRAVDRCIFGAFYQSGQSCISVQRIIVHETLYDRFLSEFVQKAKALQMGDPLSESTYIGPVISDKEAARIVSLVERRGTGKILTGGTRTGVMVPPTIVEGCSPNSPLIVEEVFGPVVSVEKFSDFKAAIASMNDTPFGLQAGIFTKDIHKIFHAYDALEFGGVVVNDVPSMRADAQPYGGIKDSGIGREGIPSAIEDMTETRVLMLRDLKL